jgi:hypothetical protein
MVFNKTIKQNNKDKLKDKGREQDKGKDGK